MPGGFEHVIALQLDENMHGTEDILRHIKAGRKDIAETVEEALALATAELPEDGLILCLGGFALAGRVLAHVRGVHYDVISL